MASNANIFTIFRNFGASSIKKGHPPSTGKKGQLRGSEAYGSVE